MLGFALGMAMLVSAFLSVRTAFAGEAPRLRVAHGFEEGHPVHRGIERFRERLAGIVAVQVDTSRDDGEAVRGLLTGEADAAVVAPAALRDIAGEMALLDLIGLWRDRDHWARALDGEPGRQFAALVEGGSRPDGGSLRVLGYWGGTRRHLLTRRQDVTTLEALAGLRVRIPIDPTRSKMWRALGVRPVLLPRAEASAALRDGVVEAVDDDAETILRDRLFEAAPHLTETGHVIATRLFLLGGATWRRFTREEQAAVTAAAREATFVARETEGEREGQTLASLRDRFRVTLSEFAGREALMVRTRSLRRRYADELGAAHLLALIEQTARP